jgi:hypothetical protein
MNIKPLVAALIAFGLIAVISPVKAQLNDFRPPAVPLVTADPYLSIWSEADHLTDKNTQHWTHREHSLVSLIRIDGQTFRLMGDDPQNVPAMPQISLKVLPTRSIYEFQNSAVNVTLTFMAADLPHDVNILTRPLSYITWSVRSIDGARHVISLYDSTSSELAVNSDEQAVVWSRQKFGTLTALKVGTQDQTLLSPAGDDTRIDWGYAYAAAPGALADSSIGGDTELTSDFVNSGAVPAAIDNRQPRPVSDDQPVLAFTFDLGSVGAESVTRHVIVAYDEIYSIEFSGKKLRPYWRRNGATPGDLLQSAENDYPSLTVRCAAFDKQLMADMTKVGGAEYAQIAALAFRECFAANGYAADSHKQLLMFTKENTSNGDIATVDVIFPQDPMLLFFSPTLAKASLVAEFDYANDPRWRFPNAPHDLGTYPIAKASGDAGEGMPVEESGNMIILADAICQEDGNTKFVTAYWPKLTQWAHFLQQYGLDPGDQLCTDDFMGHLAHNANLSVKAILALAAYGDMCRIKGDTANAEYYHNLAVVDAKHWIVAAKDGDHSRLAFDKPGTWSQKYNLVWDKILDLNVFPPSIAEKEIAYYKTLRNQFGLPLDSRTRLTKTDWSIWSATLANNQADFQSFIGPIYDYLDQTTTRDPIADSYVTDDVTSGGMHARPVVGGFFIKMLSDRSMWMKWSKGDLVPGANWAAIPPEPKVIYIIQPSVIKPVAWNYVTSTPPTDWNQSSFDDSSWKSGLAPFGHDSADGIPVNTLWSDTPGDIWLRRTVTLPNGDYTSLKFMIYHDDEFELYVNGVLASSAGEWNDNIEPFNITHAALSFLKPGATITIAVHVHQDQGGQGFDGGLAKVIMPSDD